MAGLADLQFRRVDTWDDAQDFKAWLALDRPFLGCDTETSGLLFGHDKIRLVQFGDHRMGWALDFPEWKGLVQDVFGTYTGRQVWHNSLFDLTMLKFEGVRTKQHLQDDTMVMCYLKDPGARKDLKGAAATYVDKMARTGQSVLKAFMSGGGFDWGDVPRDAEPYWVYGILDTCLTALLAEALWEDTAVAMREAYELNLAVIHVLRDAQVRGFAVDEDYRARAERKLREECAMLAAEIPFEPSKDQQARRHLLEIGADIPERTPEGNVSVDKFVLRRLFKEDPVRFAVGGALDTWRQKNRSLNNYIVQFADVSQGGMAVDGALHAHAHPVGGVTERGNPSGTITGRLSITQPALQTLPKGRVVRDALVARPGHRILQADYAGMELRALAGLAQEPNMMAAFERGEDLHDFVTQVLFGDGWTKKQRSVTKNVQFAKCLAPGNRVLTADLRWTPIEDLSPGDGLVAFDQHSRGVGNARRWRPDAVVLGVEPQRLRCVRLELSDGRQVVCSTDHQWYTGRRRWVSATTLHLGRSTICAPLDVWTQDTSNEAGWLSGLVDGEGYIKADYGMLGWAQNPGPVLDKSLEIARAHGFEVETSAPRGDCVRVRLNGGRREVMRFLGTFRPIRLLDGYERQIAAWRFHNDKKVTVVGRSRPFDHDVIAVTTSTGTYIAEGLASHNCYGAGIAQLAHTADLPEHEAQAVVDLYDQQFPRIAAFMQETVNEVMEQAGGRKGRGWVTLPDGTRLPVPGDEAYKGVNFLIQGGTAVAAKRKLVELDQAGLGDFFRLAVHDEFLFEVPDDEIDEARETLRRVMPDDRTFPGVTLTIDDDVIFRWGEHFRGPDYPPYVPTEAPEWLTAS